MLNNMWPLLGYLWPKAIKSEKAQIRRYIGLSHGVDCPFLNAFGKGMIHPLSLMAAWKTESCMHGVSFVNAITLAYDRAFPFSFSHLLSRNGSPALNAATALCKGSLIVATAGLMREANSLSKLGRVYSCRYEFGALYRRRPA